MSRKRLLALLTTVLLAIGISPAAANETLDTLLAPLDGAGPEAVTAPVSSTVDAVTDGAGSLDSFEGLDALPGLDAIMDQLPTAGAQAEPIIDEGIEGLGSLFVDIDQDAQQITVKVGIDPIGQEVVIQLPPGDDGGDDGDVQDPDDEHIMVDDAREAEVPKQMAPDSAITIGRQPLTPPAFTTNATAGGTIDDAADSASSSVGGSGSSDSGSSSAQASDGDTIAAGDLGLDPILDPNANPWLKLAGIVMLAGTASAWRWAREQGLA